MARIYSKGRGISRAQTPYNATRPEWLALSDKQIESKVCELARKGMTESQIGAFLRDEMGVPGVKTVLHNKITGLLERNDLKPEIPDGLLSLIKKNKTMRNHLAKNNKDKVTRFNLIRNESKIYRLIRHLKKTKRILETFRFTKTTANKIANA